MPMPETYFICSYFICSMNIYLFLIQLDIEEKQLPDRASTGVVMPVTASIPGKALLDFVRIALGESKLRLISFPMAEMGFSVSFKGSDDLNFLQKLMCLFNASSVDMSLSDRKSSSFTA